MRSGDGVKTAARIVSEPGVSGQASGVYAGVSVGPHSVFGFLGVKTGVAASIFWGLACGRVVERVLNSPFW